MALDKVSLSKQVKSGWARYDENPTSMYSGSINTLSAENDIVWSRYYQKIDQSKSLSPNNYFDYYMSGQDIKVYIDGIDENRAIPIEGLGWNVEQKKTPLYGVHSYVYDGVMRGNRIISGSFRLTTQYPDYLRDLIAEAANSRLMKTKKFDAAHTPAQDRSGATRQEADLENMKRYWTINPDKGPIEKRVFSSHPPFSFHILHGIQTASISNGVLKSVNGVYEKLQTDNALYQDVNERLVESGVENDMRIVLDSVEIVSMQTEYTSSGDPLAETYTFFAKDFTTKARKRNS